MLVFLTRLTWLSMPKDSFPAGVHRTPLNHKNWCFVSWPRNKGSPLHSWKQLLWLISRATSTQWGNYNGKYLPSPSHTQRGPNLQIWHSPKAALGSILSCFCLFFPYSGPSNPCCPLVPLLYFSASPLWSPKLLLSRAVWGGLHQKCEMDTLSSSCRVGQNRGVQHPYQRLDLIYFHSWSREAPFSCWPSLSTGCLSPSQRLLFHSRWC